MELYSEDRAARQSLARLEEACSLLMLQEREGKRLPASAEALYEATAFIRKGLLPHFDVEEKAVFPLLTTEEGKNLRGELLQEHDQLRVLFSRFMELMERRAPSQELMNLALEIDRGLIPHASKEDEVLIPLLRQLYGIKDDEPIPHAPPIGYLQD